MKRAWTMADVAAHWDATLDYDDINAATDSYYRRFVDSSPLFDLEPGWRVLDIDCRTAKGTAYFHRRTPGLHFTCVAMSPLFQKLAREECVRNGIAADVRVFDRLPLPFDDASFDAVLTYETLEHVPWPDAYLRELGRLTRKGGLLVLTTPSVLWEPVHWFAAATGLHHSEGPHRMVPRRQIRRFLKEAGFAIRIERTFVLVPAGPQWLLRLGRWLEAHLPQRLVRLLCLRRTFICERV